CARRPLGCLPLRVSTPPPLCLGCVVLCRCCCVCRAGDLPLDVAPLCRPLLAVGEDGAHGRRRLAVRVGTMRGPRPPRDVALWRRAADALLGMSAMVHA